MLSQCWYVVVVVLTLVLSSCAGQTKIRAGEDSLAFLARHGKLEILKKMRVPANQYKVYLQNGTAVKTVDIILPFCDLEVKRKAVKPMLLKQASFEVIGVNIDEENISGGHSRVIKSNGKMKLFTTQLFLSSEKGSNVIRLNCTKMDKSSTNGHVKLDEFKRTVGPYLTIVTR